jgi:hypothetical protein
MIVRLSPPYGTVPTAVGLCVKCVHARVVRSDRGAAFYLCQLSATDSRFPKYPRLPVENCLGYLANENAARCTPGQSNDGSDS